jgi:cytochrome c oxidase assembly factor CtaG
MFLPLLHIGNYNGPFLLAWNFDPLVTIGLIVSAVGYYWALRRVREAGRYEHPTWQVLCFYGGLLTIALALLGPFDMYNDDVFTFHMIQHMILIQATAPLLLFGRPVQLALRAISPKDSGPVLRTVLRPSGVRAVLTFLTNPVVAFFLFNGAVVLWHFPQFYDAALVNETVHVIEHMTFLGVALLYWWPMIDPIPRHHKMKRTWAVVSVFFSMMISSNGLGAILTLADSVLYTPYLSNPNPFGWDPHSDQQMGGLLMWVGGGLIWLFVALGIIIRILQLENRKVEKQQAAWDALADSGDWDEGPRPITTDPV